MARRVLRGVSQARPRTFSARGGPAHRPSATPRAQDHDGGRARDEGALREERRAAAGAAAPGSPRPRRVGAAAAREQARDTDGVQACCRRDVVCAARERRGVSVLPRFQRCRCACSAVPAPERGLGSAARPRPDRPLPFRDGQGSRDFHLVYVQAFPSRSAWADAFQATTTSRTTRMPSSRRTSSRPRPAARSSPGLLSARATRGSTRTSRSRPGCSVS
jgi:hypothetical protein